ncbi:hypothetical protein CR203_00505 [Salipaludibacillus neizhouensis]|uniref:Lipopolysaccharide assembly protein A domain-containing protein n=1 Tax=Salipaludibacillus neizhouensis TaxID=885475 RepID=A0A3A9K8P2_9BACI|nr:lipopolysaccharide assembly protein LapA domain-containing protein [Salipaludibacillus neizhouensis]RKL68569.1 hypothetical protein CR203_00505 [Salipaludibacillus neizhouensis]
MKGQWGLITSIIFILIISIFAVLNVDPVQVNFGFLGQAEWPLVIVIIASVLMGGLIVGSVGIFKMYRLQSEIKRLKNQAKTSSDSLEAKNNEVSEESDDQTIPSRSKSKK